MKSKTQIEKQLERKSSPVLVRTIISAKKKNKWAEVAGLISGPRRSRKDINLSELDKITKEGEVVLVPGKVLSQGEINKKIKIIAIGFSENAKEKLSNAKCEFSTIDEEIKKNPDAKGLRILK